MSTGVLLAWGGRWSQLGLLQRTGQTGSYDVTDFTYMYTDQERSGINPKS
jgi:hypothetical protein